MEEFVHANVAEGSSSCVLLPYSSPYPPHRTRRLASVFRLPWRRRRCRCMSNRPAPPKDFFGRPATGPTAPGATSGLRACGLRLRIRVCFGRPATGDSWAALTAGMGATGDRTSDSTAELITASATAASVSGADAGKAAPSDTTQRRGTWALASTAYTRIAPLSTTARVNNHATASMARAASVRCRPPGNAPR